MKAHPTRSPGRPAAGLLAGLLAALASAILACAPPAAAADPAAGDVHPAAAPGEAEVGADTVPTRVTVRAVAHDAKVIGSGVGGARITIEDEATGRVLARGVQEGSTGSTRLLVQEPRERGRPVHAADGAAGFTAELGLTEPTRVRITAEGPLGTPHAEQRSSATLLLVPGVDLTGEGVVLVLYGFTVRLLHPSPVDGVPTLRAGSAVDVGAHVEMLCGCPIEPGGLWDADRVQVLARLVRDDGEVVAEAELDYAGSPSTFAGAITAPSAGEAILEVVALDPDRANTGMARSRILVR